MESQEKSGQKSQPQQTRTDNQEEIKISSESIDKQLEDLLSEYGYDRIHQVLEDLEDAKQRIIRYGGANRPKQLQSAKEDKELLESILQKHAQLVQPKIQNLLDELGLDNVDELIDEKLSQQRRLTKLPQGSVINRIRCQDKIDRIDEILRIVNRTNPLSEQQPQPQLEQLPEVCNGNIFSDQEKQVDKKDTSPILKPVQQMYQVEQESLFQKEKEDAQNNARLIKSAPECFDKSVKFLIHILYQKLVKNIAIFDEFIGVPTSKYDDLIHSHLTNIKEKFINEFIENNEIIQQVNLLQHSNGKNVQQLENILTCLKRIQPLTCKFNFQEFFSYINKADEVSQNLGNSQSGSIVLLLGKTGVGKSTTIHYLCGSEMYETSIDGLKHISFGNVLNPDLNKVKVSLYSRSETRYINLININMKQLGIKTQELITLVDTPGLFNYLNAEVEVSYQISIVKALSQVQSIKPIIVFSQRSMGSRGEGFKEILNFCSEMIVDLEYIDYFNFFFSHVDKDVSIEKLKAKIVYILVNILISEKQNERLVKFLEVIIKRADENKLFIIDPLNKNQILNILKKITETDGIPRPSSVFRKVISDESSRKIIEQFDLHENSILSAFKKADSNRVDFMLTELTIFCEIMDSDQGFKQKLNDILKKLNQILLNKYNEVVGNFQKLLQPSNIIFEEDIVTYQQNLLFSFSVNDIRQKYLCQIDGNLCINRSYRDIEQEVERLINCAYNDINQPTFAKLDQKNFQILIQKLDFLANSKIENFIIIRNKKFSQIEEQVNNKVIKAGNLLDKIITLEQILPDEIQNQNVNQMSKNNDEEKKERIESKIFEVLPVDEFCDLIKELDIADEITKNSTLNQDIKARIDYILSKLEQKLKEFENIQQFVEISKINLQNINFISNLSNEDLNSQVIIQINQSQVEQIQKYNTFLESFTNSIKSKILSKDFIDQIEEILNQFNYKMIFWYAVQEEKLRRKISEDREYSAIKSICDDMMLVKDLPVLKGQTILQNRIKINLLKLVRNNLEEAQKHIHQIKKLVDQQLIEESNENQLINVYILVQLKEAIGTIEDLKWTIERENLDIYEDLREDLEGTLQKLVILIQENVKKTRDATTKWSVIPLIHFKLISQIQSIAKIIRIQVSDINPEDYIQYIESNLIEIEKFLKNKEVSNLNEESISDLQKSVNLLKKSECDKFFIYYTYLNQIRTNDFMIKKIDEITFQKNHQNNHFSDRVKNLLENFDEFIRSHMQQVNNEFMRQLNLMKEYLKQIQTLSRNEEGFYDNQDDQDKASLYLYYYLVIPIEKIISIFKMIKELKQQKYYQLWNKFSQNEDYEEDFALQIQKFYKSVENSIAMARNYYVKIINSLKVINQLIPLDLYVNKSIQYKKGSNLFQDKYFEYFKSSHYHNQVVYEVEERIHFKKYDEIYEIFITLQKLEGIDQQTDMIKINQNLIQKCNDLSTQISEDIKYLIRDKQIYADKKEELNNKQTELNEILEIFGIKFLPKPIYDKGKSVLEYFKQQISSNFEQNSHQQTKMEEEKESGVTYQERRRQEIISSTASNIDLLNSARLGTDDYDLNSVQIIRAGGLSTLCLIKSKKDGKRYAAKRLQYQIGSRNDPSNEKAAEREIGCLRVLNHPMIIGIIDLVKDKKCFPFIIIKQYSKNLDETVKDFPDQFLPEQYVLRIFSMICISLHHSHSKNNMHYNLNPKNIFSTFLGKQEIFMTIDFGNSYLPESGSLTTVKDNMSDYYSSIEQMELKDANLSFDIWSLSIILYFLMAKKEPYQQKSVIQRIQAINNHQKEKLPDFYSKELKSLVDYVMIVDHKKRPTIQQILNQPIISAEFDKILNDFKPLSNDNSTAILAKNIIDQIYDMYPEKRFNFLQIQQQKIEYQESILQKSKCAIKSVELAIMKDILQERRVKTSLEYRGSEHGWMANNFYQRVPQVGATLLLLRLKDGPCIGGFTQAQWIQTIDSIRTTDSTAMIFNLTQQKVFPVKIQQRAIISFQKGICFGEEEIQITEPFNQINNCKSWANNAVYGIEEANDGKNLLTLQNSECFTITEIELWKITGDLPQGIFGLKNQFSYPNNTTDRWRLYQILKNEENKLGEGTYADVYKIKDKKTNSIYAAKIIKIKLQYMDSTEKQSLKRELQIMKECDHPFIIKFIDQFIHLNQQYIVTSYASGGNLRSLIDKPQNFTLEEIMNYFLMILISLYYLHTKGIMQRDLHPRNILVNILPGGFKILQITDFGLSKNIKKQENYSQTLADRTALLYKAPEVFKDEKQATTKVDMWALGIILFELTAKKHPISKIVQITDANVIQIPSSFPPLIKTIIEKLLDKNPQTRPSAEELLNSLELNEAVNNIAKLIKAIDPQMASKIFQ